MSIKVTCSGCGQEYKLSDELAGKKAKCKACGAAIQIPSSTEDRLVDFDVPSRPPAASSRPPVPARSSANPPKPPPLPKSDSSSLALPRITVTCDMCFADFQAKGELAGKKAKCPECGELVSVPGGTKTKAKPKPKDEDEEIFDAEEVIEEDFEEVQEFRPKKSSKSGSKQKSKGRGSSTRGEYFLDEVPTPVLLGGMWTVILIACAMFWFLGRSRGPQNAFAGGGQNGAAASLPAGGPLEPYNLTAIPVPSLPEPGPIMPSPSGRFQFTEATFPAGNTPGSGMQVRIRLPNGNHAPKSLGCILVGGAGTPMIWGAPLQDVEYLDESQPYLDAGYAVCDYSMDGAISEDADELENGDLALPHQQFAAACAGVVNVRNALEFVLAKVPVVNPNRVYIAGHSSAAALALLAVGHEPRLKGCIAYAAPVDLVKQQGEMLSEPSMRLMFPQLSDFLRRSSPLTHIARIQCPVFLFHALDDSVVPVQESQSMASQLQTQGKTVVLDTVPTGDHYEAMTQQGIHKAVAWLKTLPTEQPGAAAVESSAPAEAPANPSPSP